MRSILKAIQADVVGTLLACDYFEDITVLAADSGDLATVINNVLASVIVKNGKTGLFVIVEEPSAEAITAIPSPFLTSIKQKITIGENRVVNCNGSTGTGKPAFLVAEVIHQVLFQSDFAGTTQGPIWPGSPAINPVVTTKEYQEIEVLLELHAPLATPNKVATPAISQGATLVTITCSTGAATIFYSVDDGFPGTTYGAPFSNPAAGVQVRAIAKLTGYAASNIASLVMT